MFDYDYFLCKDKYFVFFCYLDNFILICYICNSKVKGVKDVLFEGIRRRKVYYFLFFLMYSLY